jgi:hypothetical protein
MNFTDKGLEYLRCDDATAGVFVSAASQESGELSPGEVPALESLTAVAFVASIVLVGSCESVPIFLEVDTGLLVAILLVWWWGCYDEDICDLQDPASV